jgi:tetratricopeptide (TPR) repeat protein
METFADDRPLLSAAMIVRNEAAQLPGCLACLRGFADDVCIVDTGSTDGTQAIAREAGARVFEVAWADDFAAARNVSLAEAAGRWVFIIDADERLAAEDAETLRKICLAGNAEAYRLITRNYTNAAGVAEFVPCAPDDPWAMGYAGWFPSGKVRLFPNDPEVRFEGRVHELVNPSLERMGVPMQTSPVPVHHYPLDKDAERVAAKRALYIRLGEAKIAEAPDDPRLHAELGHQYCEVGEVAKAVAVYRKAVELEPDNGVWLRDLGAALMLAGAVSQATQALRLAVQYAPDLEDAWQNLGIAHLKQQQWQAAEEALRHAIALNDASSERYRYLAIALHGGGKTVGAHVAVDEALRRNPHNEQARALLATWRDA